MFDFKKNYDYYKSQLFDSILPFWEKHSIDNEFGGILNCLDREGKVYSTDKSVWLQGRCAYTFSKLCNTYGKNDNWLKIAKSCLDFLNDHCIDSDGRMFFLVTRDGKPLRKRRYYFSETFYIIANAEYYKATGDKLALENAKKFFDMVYSIYVNPKSDPYKITPKFCDGVRPLKSLASPMILLNVATIMAKVDVENKATYVKIVKKLVKDLELFNKKGTNLMLETVGEKGDYLSNVSSCRIINPGHSIELSWFLIEAGELLNDKSLLEKAERIFNSAFVIGWDKAYGGLLYFFDCECKPIEAYEHDMKLWWPHTEALIASMKLYQKTGNEKYLRIFQKVTNYVKKHFADDEFGEWYGYLRRDGKPTMPPCKGHTYKGPFHTLRATLMVEQMLKEELYNKGLI